MNCPACYELFDWDNGEMFVNSIGDTHKVRPSAFTCSYCSHHWDITEEEWQSGSYLQPISRPAG